MATGLEMTTGRGERYQTSNQNGGVAIATEFRPYRGCRRSALLIFLVPSGQLKYAHVPAFPRFVIIIRTLASLQSLYIQPHKEHTARPRSARAFTL